MKKVCLLAVLAFFGRQILFPSCARAVSQEEIDQATEILSSATQLSGNEKYKPDLRDKQLEAFFKSYDSPLTTYASFFIGMADKYAIDWRLLPAIAGVESTFGRYLPSGSFNAYGWGNGEIYFHSWEDSIEKVTKALSEKYYARGLTTPSRIAPIYCPPSTVWAKKVNNYINEIDKFEKKATIQLPFEL